MSNKGQDAKEISTLLSVNKRTVYVWLNNWQKHGIIGLITQPGQGRPPILNVTNENHVKVIKKVAEEAAKKGINMKEKVEEELNLNRPFSQRTLRRFLQKKTMLTNGFVDYQEKPQTKKS